MHAHARNESVSAARELQPPSLGNVKVRVKKTTRKPYIMTVDHYRLDPGRLLAK